jgi:hypothetical protein
MSEASSRHFLQSVRVVGSVVACAALLAGCSDSRVQLSGFAECRLHASIDGWVEGTQNDCGIQGSWYSYNDCTSDPSSDCTQAQQPGEGDFYNRQSWMCTCGTTAPAASTEDLLTTWGAGIALDLNAGRSGKNPSGIAKLEADRGIHLQGFSFRLVGIAPGLRVNFPTPDTEKTPHATTVDQGAAASSGKDLTCLYDALGAAGAGPAPDPKCLHADVNATDSGSASDSWCLYEYLSSTDADSEDAAVDAIAKQSLRATALFREAKQDAGTQAKDRTELDRGAVTAIQFYIPSSTQAVGFNFCIGDLTALY